MALATAVMATPPPHTQRRSQVQYGPPLDSARSPHPPNRDDGLVPSEHYHTYGELEDYRGHGGLPLPQGMSPETLRGDTLGLRCNGPVCVSNRTTRTDQGLSPTSQRLSHKGWSVDPTTQSGRRRGLDRQDKTYQSHLGAPSSTMSRRSASSGRCEKLPPSKPPLPVRACAGRRRKHGLFFVLELCTRCDHES